MAAEALLSILLCLLYFIQISSPETILGENNDDFDFDGLPGVTHEFKVDVAAGRSECFYQMIKAGAQVHMSFEVLRGADRNVDVVIKDVSGQVLDSHLWTSEGTTDKVVDKEGVYAICIDNSFSRFSSKLVYFYMVTYVAAEWDKFTKELDDLQITVENFTRSIGKVDEAVNLMKQFQSTSRRHVIKDWYLVTGNNKYIQYWSVLQCIVVVSTGFLQVFFVRRLFTFQNVTPTSKPRA